MKILISSVIEININVKIGVETVNKMAALKWDKVLSFLAKRYVHTLSPNLYKS